MADGTTASTAMLRVSLGANNGGSRGSATERVCSANASPNELRVMNDEGFSMNKLRGSVITIIFFGFTSSALAETTAFTADLRGSFEVPPTDSKAKGSAELTYDESTRKLRWTITYRGLAGKTISAHFHGPANEGENAKTMITISPLASPIKGAAILTEDQAKALLGGYMYIDVHSAKYPDGEIRGQLTPAR
jgi:hypothetical protein